MFRSMIENKLRERIDQFLKANKEWIDAADRLSKSIDRLSSLIEDNKVDKNSINKLSKDLKDLSKSTKQVSKTFKEFDKTLRSIKNE